MQGRYLSFFAGVLIIKRLPVTAEMIEKLIVSHSYRVLITLWRSSSTSFESHQDFSATWQSLNNLPTPVGIARIYGESRQWFGVWIDGIPMVEDAVTGDCFELAEAFALDEMPTLKEIQQFCEKVRNRRGLTNDEGSLGKDW